MVSLRPYSMISQKSRPVGTFLSKVCFKISMIIDFNFFLKALLDTNQDTEHVYLGTLF